MHANENKQVLTSLENLPMAPRFDGDPIRIGVLWGNPETGPVATMIQMPEGYAEQLHKHSSTYHCVIVKGDFQTLDADGNATDVYGPGSYVLQPGGVSHAEKNAGNGDLLAFVYFDGPIDVIPG